MTVDKTKTPHINQKIFQVVMAVPEGKVVTYGQVAELAGLGKGARRVGAALKMLPLDTRIPWHRVINAQGKISLPEPAAQIQESRLENESVVFLNGKIDLKKFRWVP